MNKIALLSAFLPLAFSLHAQTTKNADLGKRIRLIEDKLALKELVDHFSILADQKDAQAQTLLFTENGIVETYRGDSLVTKLIGRKQIGEVFGAFLGRFETVYHINGQHAVTIEGDKTSGVLYCLVTLIGVDNGKKIKTTIGVYYHDEYVRENNRWLIAKRKSTFAWQDQKAIGE